MNTGPSNDAAKGAGLTLQELYCADRHVSADEYAGKVFWHCLHRRAVPLAPVLMLVSPGYFRHDREFVARCGAVRTMDQLRDEIAEFQDILSNRSILAHVFCIRCSTERMKALGRRFFPKSQVRSLSGIRRR